MRPGGDIMTFIFTTICMRASKVERTMHLGGRSRPGALGRFAVCATVGLVGLNQTRDVRLRPDL
jgi:hypothetical protein